jgi:hypothetical protein
MSGKRRSRWIGAAALSVAVLGAGLGVAHAAVGSGEAAAATPLRDACGERVVVQTDWFPSIEHGYLYQLAGINGTWDSSKGRYTGVIGKSGVKLEIRAGGPFSGFQQPISQMYQDPSITLGYGTTDEAVALSKTLPTVAIVAPWEFSPQILFFNPEKLPIKRFRDIAESNAKVLVFEGGVYVDYLVSRGWIRKDQVDTSYDGSPTRFLTADGGIVNQGFVTDDPYRYKNLIPQYGKPVSYLLIRNSGYVPYAQPLVAKPEVVRAKRACFKLLVPLVQQSIVNFYKNPKPVVNELIEYVDSMKTFWKLYPDLSAYSVAISRSLGLVQNGPDCTVGNFSMRRTQGFINQVLPLYRAQGRETFKEGITAQEVVTNEFINPKIGLGKKGCKR